MAHLAAASLALLFAACATRIGGDGDPATPAGRPCESARDCPASTNPCQVWTCWEQVCSPVAAAKDTVLPREAQSQGDCRLLVCDGQGKTTSLPDDADVPPDDDNECAEDVCQDGAPASPPVEVGTPCGAGGYCNGHGKCGMCLPTTARCNENTPETCSGEGEWESAGACPASTPICSGKSCLGVTHVAAGDGFSCARLSDGKVRCFGDPSEGRMGDGGARLVGGLARVIQIDAGSDHTCALQVDGVVQCWGDNSLAQLHDGAGGETRDRAAPVPKLGVATQISAGDDFTCALIDDGKVICWGDNTYGQLGTLAPPAPRTPAGATLTTMAGGGAQSRPVEVPRLVNVSSVSLGRAHACARLTSGGVSCWGADDRGQLGRVTRDESFPANRTKKPVKPLVPVKGLEKISEVQAGGEHACVIHEDRTVSCWGRNHHGQLGDGTTSARTKPVKVQKLQGAMALSLGPDFTCALLEGGRVRCWGSGASGVLGDPAKADHLEPFEPPGLGVVATLAVGADHACAGRADGTFVCWGENRRGQLGSSRTGEDPALVEW